MGDKAQFNFLLGLSSQFPSPPKKVIYSGAAVGDNDFSKIFPSAIFHTTDIEASEHIDIPWDLETDPPNHLTSKYNLFISTSVLEHVKRPWIAAKNMEKVVSKGGHRYISAPWAWDFHEFPGDYWRFSHQAFDILFEGSTPIWTAWNTYPDCILYKHNPYIDRSMTMRMQGTLATGETVRRRGIPLLQLNQIRQKT